MPKSSWLTQNNFYASFAGLFSLVCFVLEHFVLLWVLWGYFERERGKELKAGLLGR